MRYSKPAKNVKLISLHADGPTIESLLTEKISSKLNWFSTGHGGWIGEAGMHSIESVPARYEELGYPDYFDNFDLEEIKEDGLENLYKLGGDADGNEYLVGLRSQQFFAMWHGCMEFEPVARTTKQFIQWLIRECSDHLDGCPWEFLNTDHERFIANDIWHTEDVDYEPLLSHAKSMVDWDKEYRSPNGFEIFSSDHEMDFRFKKEHRGHKSYVTVVTSSANPVADEYLAWLTDRGFATHGRISP